MWKRSNIWHFAAWGANLFCIACTAGIIIAAAKMYVYESFWDILFLYDGIKNSNHFYMILMLIMAVIALFILSFAYILISAGRKKGQEKIELTVTDKISGEIYMLIWVSANIIAINIWSGIANSMGRSMADGSMQTMPYRETVMNLGLIIIEYLFLLIFLVRYARRKKADLTFWDTSLMWEVITGLRSIYHNKKRNSRIIYVTAIGIVLYCVDRIIIPGVLLVWGVIILFNLVKKSEWMTRVQEGVEQIAGGEIGYQIDTKGMKSDELKLAQNINQLGEGLKKAVDEATKNERLKSELITNVSHDIKTPLTSIINYVDLIKREKTQNEKIQEYVVVLDEKSQRLKRLTEDLVEASKVNTGNIELHMEMLDLNQLIQQTLGEFEDKFEEHSLYSVCKIQNTPLYIYADGRRVWRVFENLLQNVYKYAMPNTRVYINSEEHDGIAAVTIKNISSNQLNIPAEELTERFIRGDVARSTEGSGLGLSIAKNLTALMGGELSIYLDGDLFRATVQFNLYEEEEDEEANKIDEMDDLDEML